jgi:AcrR family transcriptional regulator
MAFEIDVRDQRTSSLRERLLDAAKRLIEQSGWASVTMAKLAAAVGVSRQTVHTEVGTKHSLAESLVLRELDEFLGFVRERLAAENDLVEGVRSACQGILEQAETNLLLRTVLGSIRSETDTDDELLKLLTIESGMIVDAAVQVVRDSVEESYADLPFSESELTMAVEAIVRLVLSHVVRPSKAPTEAADDIARLVELALVGARANSGATAPIV